MCGRNAEGVRKESAEGKFEYVTIVFCFRPVQGEIARFGILVVTFLEASRKEMRKRSCRDLAIWVRGPFALFSNTM